MGFVSYLQARKPRLQEYFPTFFNPFVICHFKQVTGNRQQAKAYNEFFVTHVFHPISAFWNFVALARSSCLLE